VIILSQATNETKDDILKMTVSEVMSLWTANNYIVREQNKRNGTNN